MAPSSKNMPYGPWTLSLGFVYARAERTHRALTVRLGKSGLKISKIVLGTMTYGSPQWQGWVLEEKKAIEHIRYA
jgi:hypothetical protein